MIPEHHIRYKNSYFLRKAIWKIDYQKKLLNFQKKEKKKGSSKTDFIPFLIVLDRIHKKVSVLHYFFDFDFGGGAPPHLGDLIVNQLKCYIAKLKLLK